MTTPDKDTPLIFVVEDEADIARLIASTLGAYGFRTETFGTGRALLSRARREQPELAILDLGLPDMDGLQVLRELQENHPCAALILTGRDGLTDRVLGLELGADDYLVKPVDLDEVNARVRAITRRVQQAQGGGSGMLSHGALKLQPARRTATWQGQVVPLTNREFWLLETLVRKKGQILSRERLEETLYGWGDEIDSNAVEVYIHHLRRKFEPGLIKTVRGLGYQLGLESADD